MKQTLYTHYLKAIIQEAIGNSEGTTEAIANYLSQKKKPGLLHKAEEKEAFSRVQKVFTTSADRPLWFVLSCLGLKPDDFEGI